MTALTGRTYDCTVRRRFALKNLANRAVPHMRQSQICTPKHIFQLNYKIGCEISFVSTISVLAMEANHQHVWRPASE